MSDITANTNADGTIPEATNPSATNGGAAAQAVAQATAQPAAQGCDCPPPAERAAAPATADPRDDLLRMATELARTRDRSGLSDYLRLRRAANRAG